MIPKLTYREALKIAERESGMTANQIMYERKDRPRVLYRQGVMVGMARIGYSQPRIGMYMGKDHTTIGHAVRSFRKFPDPTVAQIADAIERAAQEKGKQS